MEYRGHGRSALGPREPRYVRHPQAHMDIIDAVQRGEVSELVDEHDLGSCAARRGSSSLPFPTRLDKIKNIHAQVQAGSVAISHPLSDESAMGGAWRGLLAHSSSCGSAFGAGGRREVGHTEALPLTRCPDPFAFVGKLTAGPQPNVGCHATRCGMFGMYRGPNFGYLEALAYPRCHSPPGLSRVSSTLKSSPYHPSQISTLVAIGSDMHRRMVIVPDGSERTRRHRAERPE